MKTPTIYTKQLNNGILTTEMLEEAIYSVSKRAKHHRDKEYEYRQQYRWKKQEYRYYYDKYDNADRSYERKNYYYKQKDVLLKLLQPTAIHTSIHYMKIKFYENEPGYKLYVNDPKVHEHGTAEKTVFAGEITHYDRYTKEYVTEYKERYLDPFDDYGIERASSVFECPPRTIDLKYIVVDVPQTYDIYLYYEGSTHSFHKPIDMGLDDIEEFKKKLAETMKAYPKLDVYEIDDLFVPADALTDILSSQFTDKVVKLVESGDYTFDSTTQETNDHRKEG